MKTCSEAKKVVSKPREDEEELVRRAKQGDEFAFGRLVRHAEERVRTVTLRQLGGATHSDEVAQDAFFRAWRRIRSFDGSSTFSTWVCSIAIHLSLDDIRRRTRRRVILRDLWEKFRRSSPDGRLAGLPDEADKSSSCVLPFRKSRDPVSKLVLEEAILKLPPKQRVVFNLFAIEGYTHKEISRILEIAEGTSKAHLNAARRKLVETLNEKRTAAYNSC